MLNFKRTRIALVLALCSIAPSVAMAAGETDGRIEGVITEAASGAPVPGATISVNGPKLIGGARTITARDDGRYEVIGLPSGRYSVEVSYSGVKPIKRVVFVRQGETTPLDIAWSPELAEAEVTTVVEERHMTKPDSTQTGTVLSSDTEGKIAMADRRYQFFAQQVAGVTGGLQNNVKGGNILQNKFLIDGMDITDPVTGTFSANLNLDLVASEEVLTGGMEAQYNSLGGVFNVITNSGSDDWHVDASVYINNSAFSANNKYGSGLLNGYRQFETGSSPPTQKYQANLNFGGPILKHHLWFNISGEYLYEETSSPAGPPINVQHPAYYRHQFLGNIKLTWAPNERHRITLAVHTDPAFLSNIDGKYSGLANFELGVAEEHQNQGGAFVTISYDYFKSQNFNFDVNAGFQWENLVVGPQGQLGTVNIGPTDQYGALGYSDANKKYDASAHYHQNTDDGTVWYQGSIYQGDNRYNVTLDPSVSFRGNAAGYHDAKIGIQSKFLYHTDDVYFPGAQNVTIPGFGTGGVAYFDGGGGPLESGLCNEKTFGNGCSQREVMPRYHNHQYGIGGGLFLQDRWKPFKRLTILPGIRLDTGLTKNSYGQTVSNMFAVGPRLGFSFDLTGDSKTIFAAYYGRANDTLDLLPTSFADYSAVAQVQQYSQTSKQWTNEYQAGGAGGYRIDPHAIAPHTDEVTLSLRRELFHDTVATVDYTYKKSSNLWDAVEVNQIWNPSGTQVVGYVNGQAETVYKVSTPHANSRTYQGIDFIVESRPTANWDVYLAYTLSWLYGAGAEELGQIAGIAGSSQFYNLRQQQFYYGWLPEDVRHNLKGHAAYSWHGITASVLFNYATGAPVSQTFWNANDQGFSNRRAPVGFDPGKGSVANSTPNNIQAASEYRLPDELEIDGRLAYDFTDLIKQHLQIIADFFNVLNLNAVEGIVNTNNSQFNTVTARQAPFRFEIGLRYTY